MSSIHPGFKPNSKYGVVAIPAFIPKGRAGIGKAGKSSSASPEQPSDRIEHHDEDPKGTSSWTALGTPAEHAIGLPVSGSHLAAAQVVHQPPGPMSKLKSSFQQLTDKKPSTGTLMKVGGGALMGLFMLHMLGGVGGLAALASGPMGLLLLGGALLGGGDFLNNQKATAPAPKPAVPRQHQKLMQESPISDTGKLPPPMGAASKGEAHSVTHQRVDWLSGVGDLAHTRAQVVSAQADSALKVAGSASRSVSGLTG